MLPISLERLALFLPVMAVVAFTPGPANIFAIATGVRRGPRAALEGVAGMYVGTLVWFFGAAFGLHALMTAYPGAFRWLAILGGTYVAWLGAQALWGAWRGGASHLDDGKPARPGAAFRDGMAVQLANPKALLFFTAILPPFLDPAAPLGPQLFAFGVIAIGMDVIAMSAYGLGAGALADKLRQPNAQRAFSAIVGALFLITAAFILLRM